MTDILNGFQTGVAGAQLVSQSGASVGLSGSPPLIRPPLPQQSETLTVQQFNAQLDGLISRLDPDSKTALFDEAKGKIQGNPEMCKAIVPQGSYSGSLTSGGKLEFFHIRSKDFGIVKNADDKYNIFDKIKKSLFSELQDVLHETGLIKGMKVGYQSNK
jgi:hypothetical protein